MSDKIPDEAKEKIFEYVLNTPKALVTLVFSWLSGHLWVYIVLTYFKDGTKGKKFLDGHIGKTAIGLLWFSLIMIPTYYFSHSSLNIEYEKLLSSVFSTLLYGLALQAIIFILLTLFKRG